MYNMDYIPCPFCDKNVLEIRHTAVNIRAGMRSSRVHTMSGTDVLISEKCSNCSRNSTEIRKEYKKHGVRFN